MEKILFKKGKKKFLKGKPDIFMNEKKIIRKSQELSEYNEIMIPFLLKGILIIIDICTKKVLY